MHSSDADRPLTGPERVALAVALCLLAWTMLLAQGCAPAPAPLAEVHWGVPAVFSTYEPSETAAYVMKMQQKVVDQLHADYPKVEMPTLVWNPCDEINGYYDPLDNQIIVCAEDLEHPGLSIHVAAHEFGHAILMQLAGTGDEASADDMAVLGLARHGWFDEMLEAAIYMQENWPADPDLFGGHPGAVYRAWELTCAESAAEAELDPQRPTTPECRDLYHGLQIKYDHRIPPHQTRCPIEIHISK